MSHEKVKKIRITNDKVYIASCSNNVWPKRYDECEWPSMSTLLIQEGREAVEKEILFAYFEGSFQSITNDRYQRAINRIKGQLTEDPYELWNRCRKDPEFYEAFKQRLYDCFMNPPRKQPCCLEGPNGLRVVRVNRYNVRLGKTNFRIYHDPSEAAGILKTHGLEERGFQVVIL